MSNAPRKDNKKADAGFTMIFDEIVREFGLTTAAVYGVVHRHCLMRDGVCRASTRRLGELVGLSHYTVQRELGMLCEFDYLIDTTPNRRNRPHVYRDCFLNSYSPREINDEKSK
jgi:hypothetical protein